MAKSNHGVAAGMSANKNPVPGLGEATLDDEARWRARAVAALRGAPFERLISSADGLTIQPLYQRLAEDRPRPWRAGSGAWRICARIDHPDAATAATQLHEDIENGADAIELVVAGSRGAYGFGLPATPEAIGTALARAPLHTRLPVELDMPARAAHLALAVADLIEATKADPAARSIGFGIDPLDSKGAFDTKFLARTAKELTRRGWRGRFAVADARAVHAAGGAPARELAFACASALASWRALEQAGVALDALPQSIGFRIAVDADELMSIAKLRALRRLWARIAQVCGATPTPIHIHAETAWRMMTRHDPHANLLRTTIAAFAAGVGGADIVTVLPFTQALGLPDQFARRLARNIQLVLIEEAHLGFVADASAGSGAFETLTDALCEQAWSIFQGIENLGGLAASLSDGAFQSGLAAERDARAKAVARGVIPMIGVSAFPELGEAVVDTLESLPLGDEAADDFSPRRDAEPFDRLRERSLNMARATGWSPAVFLAILGSAGEADPRIGFARGFFAAGGLEAIVSDGNLDDSALAAAFARSGAAAACLCGPDAVYVERAAGAAGALTKAGARPLFLAGRPGEQEAMWRAGGVDDFIYVGSDMIAALSRI